MKCGKVLSMLLAGLLLLSGCAKMAELPPVETATAPLTEAKPAEPPPLPTTAPVELRTLEPFTLDEKYARWYPETTLELIPRDDYGVIYPYIGGVTRNHWGDYESTYGFCTASGVIICDPNYRDVMWYESEGERVYVYRKTTGRAIPREWDEVERDTMYLTASDAHFVLEYESVQPGGEGTFAVKKGGKWGSVDYRGTEILPCAYEHPMTFSDGLAVVTGDFETEYHYVDKQNRTVLGPFPANPREVALGAWEMGDSWGYSATLNFSSFHEGRAAFCQDGKYGFIDKTGAVVIPAQYTTSWWQARFRNGRAIVSLPDGNEWLYALIDTDGNEIIPMGALEMSLERDNDDGIYEIYDRQRQRAWLIDRDGTVCIEPYKTDGTYGAKRYGYIGDGWFFEYDHAREAYTLLRDGVLYDVGGPFSIQPIGENRFYARYAPREGIYIDKIIDSSGKVYFEGIHDQWISFYDTLSGCAIIYTNDQLYGVIDFDGNEVIPMIYDYLSPVGGHYLARQGIYGGLLNASGEWVIKVSLLDSMED